MDARTDSPLDVKAVAAVVLGNALEFYDFLAYSFFAKEIGDAFFPSGSDTGRLLSALLVFWIGFFSRPVGAVVLGAFADKAGRKPAMILTIALMAAGMLIIAATPTFKTIGWAAPALVVIGRLVQGFALGGEVGPSTAYLVEAAAPSQRGLMASWQLASQGVAQLLAGGVGIVLAFALGSEAMHAWGWRIPFVLGVLIVPVGLVIRNHLPETAEADNSQSIGEVLGTLSGSHARLLVAGFLMIMASTVATYAGINMPTYAQTTLGLSLKISAAVTVALGVSSIVFSLAGGWLADRIGRRPLMIYPRFAVALVAIPAFAWIVHEPSAASIITVTVVISILTNFASAGSIAGIPEALPRSVRSAGLSVAYALAVTVFGGSTQWVINKLIAVTGDKLAPAYYLAATGLIGALAAFVMPETRGREID
jgi:MFS family permease